MQGNDPSASSAGARPGADAIREQLRRILASREFQATDRVREFLRFIVEETLAGRADQLKGYSIALAVFERGEDFDPAQDPIVRIQAGRLRRALERYYLVAGEDDPIVIDVPKGRYVPRFGWRKNEPGSAGEAIGAPPGEPVVAVLPFENLTGDPGKNYFAIGLAEELVTEMSHYEDLTVIPCHRALASGSPPPDLDRFCRSLGARFLLQGSVRSDSESVKVAVQLVDAATGRQIWAHGHRLDLDAAVLIRSQEEIAHDVVASIANEQGIIARRLAAESSGKATVELSTYEAMLRYYTYQIAPSPTASTACFAALRAAAEREADYGPVWSALATLYCQMHVFDVPEFEDPLATAMEHAQRGASLEPQRQVSRVILAYVHLLDDNLDSFRAEAARALELNPANPYVAGTVGYLHVLAGDFAQGRAMLQRAMQRNPFHPHWFRHGVYLDCFRSGEYEKALEAVRGRDETGFWHPAIYAAVLGKLDRIEEAAPFVAALREQKPDFALRARELLSRPVKVDWLVDELVDGLRSAGAVAAEPN